MPKKDLPKPDAIIVSSLSLLTIFNGLLLRRKFKCRLIFEIRDIWPLTLTEEGGFSSRNPFVVGLSCVEKLGYRNSDSIVGTMPNLQEHVDSVCNSTKPVYCIPMGVTDTALAEQELVSVEYLKSYIPSDKFIVAHAGTIGSTNALDTFFECAEALAANTKIHFCIIGDGDLREYYQKKYEHLDNITFAPRVKKSMVQSILSKCDLLYFSVHDSKIWQFGQSLNKVIDYMLAGKPILASYSGFPSMINEAGSGTYIPAGDAKALESEIIKFSGLSEKERQKMGNQGREWVLSNRTYQVLADNYLKILFPDS